MRVISSQVLREIKEKVQRLSRKRVLFDSLAAICPELVKWEALRIHTFIFKMETGDDIVHTHSNVRQNVSDWP